MTHALMEKESFQAEFAERVLKWLKHHSNTAALVVYMQWEARFWKRMLGFLQKVLNADSKYMSGRLVEAMCDSISSLSSVREYRELEEMCGVAFTDRFLKGELMWERTWRRRSGEWIMHSYWADVVWEPSLLLKWRGELDGWRLWDAASDYEVSHTRGLQLLSRILSHHGKGNHPYPLCDITPLEDSWSLMGTLAVKTLQGAGDLDIF